MGATTGTEAIGKATAATAGDGEGFRAASRGGFDAYAIAAAQSATYVNGQWYFGPVKWLRNYPPLSGTVGDFCHFP